MTTPPQCWYAEAVGFNRKQQCFLEEGHAGDHDCGLFSKAGRWGPYWIAVALLLGVSIGRCTAPTAPPTKQISCNPCASKAMDAMLDCMGERLHMATESEWERQRRRARTCRGAYKLDVADCVDEGLSS